MTASAATLLAALRALAATQQYRTNRQRGAAFEIVDAAAQSARIEVLREIARDLNLTTTSVARHLALDIAQTVCAQAQTAQRLAAGTGA